MISPKDSIELEVHFAAEGVRAGFTRFIDERSADLKAMVAKFCDELARETSIDVIEEKVRAQVRFRWHEALTTFIAAEAHGRVYEEIEKLRRKVNTPTRKRARRKATP